MLGKNITKIFVVVFCVFFLRLFVISPAFAISPQDYGLVNEKILPGEILFPLKRLKEKVSFLFKFKHEAKINYSKFLLDKRLSELITLVDQKSDPLITQSSQRYAYQAGITANLAEKYTEKYKGMVEEAFSKGKPILEKLRDNYPANSARWLELQQDIDTLNILFSRLK